MLDSRIGAAFTFGLLLMLGIIAIETFGSDNLLVIKGLVPAITLRNEINSTNTTDTTQFKLLNITVETYAPFSDTISDIKCNDIVLENTRAKGLTECKKNTFQETKWKDSAIFCHLHMNCYVSGSIRGTNTINFAFPDNFQNIQWAISTSAWDSDDNRKTEGLQSSFGPSQSTVENTESMALVGTAAKPTKVSFGVIRSKFINNIEKLNQTSYGIQLSYLGLDKEENGKGTVDGKHHVSLEFDVEKSVYVKEESDKVEMVARIASMFALLLTAMSGMKFVKVYLELIIDKCYIKYKEKIPEDVLRRQSVLDEHNTTPEDTRRLSPVLLRETSNTTVPVPKLRRHSSAGTVKSKNFKSAPKKKRRTSSRDLMRQQSSMDISSRGEIEMAELGLRSGTGGTDTERILYLQEEIRVQKVTNVQQKVTNAQQNEAIVQLQAQVRQLLAASDITVVEPESTLNLTVTKGHKSKLTELPEGWEKLYDATTGDHYYANATMKQSRWDAPPGSTGGSAGDAVNYDNPLQKER